MLISKELDNKIKPASIYSYVVNDRFGVRKLLVHEISNGKSSDSENPDSERSESSFNSKNKSNIIFSLTFRKTEFEDLIMETTRQYKDKKGVSRTSNKTYTKRAEIMVNFCKINPQPGCIETLDCACNILSRTNFLLKNSPSFGEISSCRAGCPPRIKILQSISKLGNPWTRLLKITSFFRVLDAFKTIAAELKKIKST